jgi:hypothetical protein
MIFRFKSHGSRAALLSVFVAAAFLLIPHSRPLTGGAEAGGTHESRAARDPGEGPALVRVSVTSDKALEVLRSLGARLYLRGDGFVVVKMDRMDLPSLRWAGVPWRELAVPEPGPLYYLLPGRGTPALPFPGLMVVDDNGDGAIVVGGDDAIAAARGSGHMVLPLDREWPLWPSGFLGIEFVHDVVARDNTIYNRTRLVSPDTLASYIQHLQDYGTRHSDSPEVVYAGRWLVNTLGRFGYPDTLFEVLQGPKGEILGRAGNVTGSKPGRTKPEYRVLVGGHYDSITNGEPVPPQEEAPGADDNASGVAAGLEIARMLANVDLDATVEYVFFSEEEQGLIGSRRFAQQLVLDGVPTDHLFFINMDMIGNMDHLPWQVYIFTDKASEPLARLTSRVAEAYTTVIPVIPGNAGRSDHAMLQQVGYPAIFLHEVDFSQVYHSRRDLLSYLEMDYMAEVVRIVMATVLHLATSAAPPSEIVATRDEAGDVMLEWTHSADADLIKYQVELLDGDGTAVDTSYTADNYTIIPRDKIGTASSARVSSVDVLGAGEPGESIFIGTGAEVSARAYPSPAGSRVSFQVFVPGVGSSVDGTVNVWDAAGRLVHSRRYESLGRGSHVLDWVTESPDGEKIPSGVYFYRFEAEGLGGHGGKLLILQ